jgi:hypothetical protein
VIARSSTFRPEDRHLFSEVLATSGLARHNGHDHFQRLMAQANRSHVAFYTFDAAGLRIASTVGYAEAAPFVGLQMMADETGGAFVDSTNDLGEGIDRVTADLHQYYLLGYVLRKAARRQVPNHRGQGAGKRPDGARAERLPREQRPGPGGRDGARGRAAACCWIGPRRRTTFQMRVRHASRGDGRLAESDRSARARAAERLDLRRPARGAKPTARLTIVARVKDGKSEVVQYAGQTYDLTGQAGLTRAGAGDVLFYRDVTLPRVD